MSQAHDLSSISYQGGHPHQADRVVIVVSKWNQEVTEALYEGAYKVLREEGVRDGRRGRDKNRSEV